MDRERVLRAILEAIGPDEMRLARAYMGSATLRAAMELVVDASTGTGTINIPHYWAVYLHDGRGPVRPVTARKIVFFADPKDDPRLAGGYPVRASDIVRLTRDQYIDGLERNAENRKAGLPPFMYVVDSTGPATGEFFFDKTAEGSADRNGPAILAEFDRQMQSWLDTTKATQPQKDAAIFLI